MKSRPERFLALFWLISWAVAVMAQNAPQWWVLGLIAVVFITLTILVSLYVPAARRFALHPARTRGLVLGAVTGALLFLCYFLVFHGRVLAEEGHISAAHMIWAVLIAPLNEELAFRAIFYNATSAWCAWIGLPRIRSGVAIVFSAVCFAALHQRTSVFLLMTFGAGLLYGVVRWRTNNVQPAIACHMAYNALVVVLLAR